MIFFRKELCHSFPFRFGIKHIKRTQPRERRKNIQHTLAGFKKILYIHIANFKGSFQMPVIRCEHGNTGGGIVFIKLIQQMGGKISCLIHLTADMHSAVTVVGGKIFNLFTHSFLPSILILSYQVSNKCPFTKFQEKTLKILVATSYFIVAFLLVYHKNTVFSIVSEQLRQSF